jgi:hypothetical protein
MHNLALHYSTDSPRLYTVVGLKRDNKIVLENCSAGCGLYGPYVNLPKGMYYASICLDGSYRPRGQVVIDVCRDRDSKIIATHPLDFEKHAKTSREIGIDFYLFQNASLCQVRLHCAAGVSATILGLDIEFQNVDTEVISSTVSDGIVDGTVVAPPFVRRSLIRRAKAFIRGPLAVTRNRPEAALIGGLPSLAAERVAEVLAQRPVLSFFKQSGVPSTQIWLPDPAVGLHDGPYMQTANCVARDFYHRDFATLCHSIGRTVALHRKLWEFAFIWHHLCAEGTIRPGARGVGFGVGREALPSLFAKNGCVVQATDAPLDANIAGWIETGDHANTLEDLYYSNIISREIFGKNVQFEYCDMNAIGDHIRDYDFCWSACSFEHLGSIENGLDFVVNSVEKALKVGGVACHTSELNLSSNDATVDRGGTVLFRRRDVERLIERLENRGHNVKPLPIEPGNSFLDFLVDVPPYTGDIHLRVALAGFVSTSFGIVVTRGI